MSEYIEYTIKIKDEKSSLSEKHISYEPLLLSKDNEELAAKIHALFEKFRADNDSEESPEITIPSKMVWQS
jgi:hypothetical protein